MQFNTVLEIYLFQFVRDISAMPTFKCNDAWLLLMSDIWEMLSVNSQLDMFTHFETDRSVRTKETNMFQYPLSHNYNIAMLQFTYM